MPSLPAKAAIKDKPESIRLQRNNPGAVQGQDGAGAHWQADRLLFLNDVYFCAQDTIRLLQHTDVDLACGMDFNFVSVSYCFAYDGIHQCSFCMQTSDCRACATILSLQKGILFYSHAKAAPCLSLTAEQVP